MRTGFNLGLLAATLFAGGCASMRSSSRATQVDAALSGWSEQSSAIARRLISRYGLPDEAYPMYLSWRCNGRWKRTTVWDAKPPFAAHGGLDVLEQTTDYPLTEAQAAELAALSDRLIADPLRRELSARSNREEDNFLAINLADDVVRRRKTLDEARRDYMAGTGRSSWATAELLFAFGSSEGNAACAGP